MTDKRIDLHVHTTSSDGIFSPREIIDQARNGGLAAVGITDHDTADGLDEAVAYGEKVGFEVVPGIELSAESPYGSYHILGYYFDWHDAALNTVLDEIRDFRDNRNPKIIAKLNGLGIDITLDEVVAEAGGGVIGRPHMAKVLLRKGAVATMQEAFDRYLATGAAAHVDKKRVSAADAVGMITAAGGIPVWAHPGIVPWNDVDTEFETELVRLKELGLRGIEAMYGSYSRSMTERCMGLAEKHGLLVTGGSDFHGGNKKHIRLGSGSGDLAVPYAVLDALKRARSG